MSLADELTNDPLGRGYSGMTAPEVLADLQLPLYPSERRVDERNILNEFGNNASQAHTFLSKLEAVAEANPLVARVIGWIKTPVEAGGGLDVGVERVRQAANGLVGTAGIVQAEIDGLLALAPNTKSRLEVLGLSKPRLREIRAILGE